MNGWQVSARLHLALVVGLAGSSIGLLGLPVRAEESVEELRQEAVEAFGSETVETLSSEADAETLTNEGLETSSSEDDNSTSSPLIATETQGNRPIAAASPLDFWTPTLQEIPNEPALFSLNSIGLPQPSENGSLQLKRQAYKSPECGWREPTKVCRCYWKPSRVNCLLQQLGRSAMP